MVGAARGARLPIRPKPNSDTGGEFTLQVHAPTPRVPQRLTDVCWPEAYPQATLPPAPN